MKQSSQYPKDVQWDMAIEPRPVYTILEDTVEKYGSRPAFDFMNKKYSYAQLGRMVNQFAAGLQKIGVKKDVKVGLFLPNSPYFIISYYAILKAGGTVVNYNPLYAEREIEYQINDSDTEIMITLDLKMLYDKVDHCLHATDLKKIIVCGMKDILPFPKNILFSLLKKKDIAGELLNKAKWGEDHYRFDDLLDNENAPTAIDIDVDNDVAVIQYTGGTTGVPKGAMLTHTNIYANTHQAAAWFTGVEVGKDSMLGVLPFFHVFAMIVVMNLSVKNAMEIIAMPRFDMEDALKIIDKKKPTMFPAVPAIYSGIVHHKNIKKYDLSSIRYCISGGAPLAVEVKHAFEKITGCKLAEGYGLTESSPVAACNPLEGINKPGSIGLPLPQTVIEIISRDDGITVMPTAEAGELCIRGPQVMKGYYKRDDETASTIRNGRLHTGDVAYIDEEGYIFIIDRIKDLIITNGYNVYPRHVEEAIYKHQSVQECIVGGLPDIKRGEIVKAWIKLKDGHTLSIEEMKEHLSDKVSAYEMPRQIEFRDTELPKTMIGKLSRKDIIAQEVAHNATKR